ncbi:MAG: hypothetical protein ACI8UR_000505, partial [Natronomonas sp.]
SGFFRPRFCAERVALATPRRKKVEVKDIVNLASVAVVDAQ